jgi:hypothetical protein
MKKIISGLVIIIAMSGLLFSCYYDKADILYNHGGSTCDTMSVISYSTTVRPILEQKCYSCHSGSRPSGGIAMGTHATDKVLALNGRLYGTINHESGYSPMPQGEAKMEDCSIAKIKKWVDAGSADN